MLYLVPRHRKFFAAGPHSFSSHSKFDSNPPAANTTARASTLCVARRRYV